MACVVVGQGRSGSEKLLPLKGLASCRPADTSFGTPVVWWSVTRPIRHFRSAARPYPAVFRGISTHDVVEERLTGAGVRHILLQRAALAKRMAHAGEHLPPHGLRAGLITKADPTGARDKPIAAPTRPINRPTRRRDRQLTPGDNLERSRTPLAAPDRDLVARGVGQGAEAR